MTVTQKTWEVAIVGAGFSGLAMAIRLEKAGRHDFVVLEEAAEVGGTWRENTYPGCACDIPSHLYSFSFEPNPNWSRQYPRQHEIWDYLRRCAHKYRINPHIRFNTKMVSAEFDDIRGTWLLTTDGGETIKARALVGAFGPLRQPALPDLPGLGRFTGKTFHSARWDHGYDLTGKRVAVIGTGASAIQFVPEIARRTARLHIFQRTAPWVLPKPDREITGFEHTLFRLFPPAQRAFRTVIYWRQEAAALGFVVDPRLMRLFERLALRNLRHGIDDPRLREALTPDYRIGCKRILISNDYYPTLNRPDVELTTSPITEIRERGVVTADGAEREVDAIIFGTGFKVVEAMFNHTIIGSNGLELRDAWTTGPKAYHGIALAGFPNLFLLVGPNTGLGHNSIVFMIETQVRHIMRCLRELDGGRTIDVKASAERAFNEWVRAKLSGTVWQTGCRSWYLDRDGRNRTLWPGFTFTYWWRTRSPKLSDYEVAR
jgi:cation diffusion facilitator CzcD-associated flavoprotein CzcO